MAFCMGFPQCHGKGYINSTVLLYDHSRAVVSHLTPSPRRVYGALRTAYTELEGEARLLWSAVRRRRVFCVFCYNSQ